MKVRALKECFVGNMRRQVGDVFNAPKGTALRTGNKEPVLELVKGSAPGRKRRQTQRDLPPGPPGEAPEIDDEDENTEDDQA